MSWRCGIVLGEQRFRQHLRAIWGDDDAARRVLQIEDPSASARPRSALAAGLGSRGADCLVAERCREALLKARTPESDDAMRVLALQRPRGARRANRQRPAR